MKEMSAQKRGKRKHSEVEDSDKDEAEALNYSDEEGGIRVDDIYVPPPPRALCSTTDTGPRLIITKISNEWFKSYANLQEVGPFHKCFNAIVGPNGSGKSNVIDSLLFVFGYRASKIRSKKLSALLHNSESYQSILSCTVSVYFAEILDKEGDTYDIIPNSEFAISRTANKDNSSFYQLNGRRVQFKEVAVLLRKHGVDLDHNRFLILQGEVEQIALMKCKAANEHETGMLEYLEDIIGTTRYKEPLLKLYDRVEILTEQRSEKINRLKMVENELEELKGPMEEAVGFLELENTITKNKNVLYQKNIYDLEEQTKSVDARKAKVEEEQKRLVDELHALGEQKKEKQTILEKDMQKYQSLEKRKEMLKEAFDKANNKDIELQASMQQLNKTRKKTKELLAEERQKLAGYETVPEKNAESIAECETKEKELLKKKENLEEEKTKLLSTLRRETQELQQQKESLQTELVGLKKLQDEAKSAYQLAESELNIFVSNEEKEREKLNVLREKHESAQKTIQEYTTEIQQLQKKIPATEKSLREANAELNAVKLEEAQVIAQIRSKRMSVEESKAAMQASRSRGRILDSLMQQKREGNCPGLFGRLGDLGAIDQKYDVAISTACGPLDNIVVDTVKTAQWCIEFLKQHDIGRATFIALDKQEHLRARANSQIQTPENVPRLFNLIRIQDERVKTAFYFALRDTLVADHLDQASRIAYGARRYRVVTLGGDLIETTGTMSGGGKTVSRGRMGQAVAVTTTQPQDVQKLEDDLEQLEQHVRELRERQMKLEGQINVLQPELRQMKINLEKFTLEVQRLKEQVPMLAQQLKAQEAKAKSTKADPAKVKAMSAVVAKKREAFDEASATVASFQVEVDAVTKEINDKTSGKMKIMDKNINDVNKTIDKCKTEITRLNVAIKTAERNAKKSAEKIATMEQDIENAENNLRKMKEQREEIEEDGKQLLTCTKEVEEQLAAGGDQFDELKEAVKELTKAENKLKGEKIDVDQRLSAFKKNVNDLKAQIHGWRVKLSQLKMQKILDATLEELTTYSPEELENQVLQQLQRELQANQEILKTVKPNLSAIDAYRKKQDQYVQRSKELDELSEKRNKMHEMHEMLRVKRKEEFLTGYNIIRKKLKEIYQMITLGGDADFELVDTYDPFTEGIQFNVRPPKKSWKSICNLSGGEKTLSSLALVFAIHYYKPSPLYVMDEIDAALDFKNVSIIGNYIKERTKNAQFIIISLRSNMFELCNYLIGIYKTFNCTKSVTIDPCAIGSSENDEEINNENQNPNVNANTNPVVEADTNSNVNNVVANYGSETDLSSGGGTPKTILVTANVHQSAPENPEDDNVSSLETRIEDGLDDVVVDDSFHSSSNSMDMD